MIVALSILMNKSDARISQSFATWFQWLRISDLLSCIQASIQKHEEFIRSIFKLIRSVQSPLSQTKRQSTKELMLSNCGAGEDSWVPWTARRSNQSILKEISPEYSLEGLRLKLQYFGHLMWRIDSLEKTLMLGKIEERRRRGRQRMRWLMT